VWDMVRLWNMTKWNLRGTARLYKKGNFGVDKTHANPSSRCGLTGGTAHPPNPKTSATLKILILAPHKPTKIATISTIRSDDAPSMKRGLKILYNIRCLLKWPAHIVVAKLIVA
jgi:hypothetical protein